ncbi:MAG TPA: ComEA family DNA-binding protein, partial [Candidatus Nesterenkonia stercoripullorum]|nr:ComEA family DNA-binding protein [Candidatus Nesterenkonia stercoripullorum]
SGVARLGIPLSAVLVLAVLLLSWLGVSWITRVAAEPEDIPQGPDLAQGDGGDDGEESSAEATGEASEGAGGAAEAGAPGEAGSAGTGAPQAAGGAAETQSTSSEAGQAQAIVHVIGAVQEPGVVEIPAGARIFEAVDAAGGVSKDAALEGINMAAPIHDGMLIWVPTREELEEGAAPPAESVGEPGSSSGSAAGAPGSSGSGASGSGGAINVNTADETQLQELSGIGPALAQRIIEHRESNGPFTSLEDLGAVRGIGPVILEDLSDKVSW